jgi:hypothetical protein
MLPITIYTVIVYNKQFLFKPLKDKGSLRMI